MPEEHRLFPKFDAQFRSLRGFDFQAPVILNVANVKMLPITNTNSQLGSGNVANVKMLPITNTNSQLGSGNVANVEILPIAKSNSQLGSGNIGTGNIGNTGNIFLHHLLNVANHLRHPPSHSTLRRTRGYGGQDVEVLPVPIPIVNERRIDYGT